MTHTDIDYAQARRALQLIMLLKKRNTRIVLNHLKFHYQTVTEITNSIPEYQQPEVSHVLSELKKLNLVNFHREGKCVMYRLNIDEIERIDNIIKGFR